MDKPMTVYFGFRNKRMRNRVAWAMGQEAARKKSVLTTVCADSDRPGVPIYSLQVVCKDLQDAKICLEAALEIQDCTEEIRCD
jgi:hypothetical protein